MMIRIVRAIVVSSFWWWAALMALFFGVRCCSAAHPEEQKIRAVLDANFDAYNREDLPDMMATLSPTLPGRAEFERQSEALFKVSDAYISVIDFELMEVRGPWAVARVVQKTMPGDAKAPPTPDEEFYRENSALLPSEEETEYLQGFKKERGKWRLWLVMTKPKRVDTTSMPAPRKASMKQNGVNVVERDDCPDGNCKFPRVRVTVR